MTPEEMEAWIAANSPTPTESPSPAPQRAANAGVSPGGHSGAVGLRRVTNAEERYARDALDREIRILESTTEYRNNRLNEASVRLFELVGAGALAESDVQQSLELAANRIGLDSHEYQATIASGRKKGISQPRDLSHVGKGNGSGGSGGSGGLPPRDGPGPGKPNPDDGPPCPEGHEENPHRLARAYLSQECSHPDGRTLQFWGEEFYSWSRGCYQYIKTKEVNAVLARFLYKNFERIYNYKLMQAARPGKEGEDEPKGKLPVPIPVTTNIVGHVRQALSGEVMLSRADVVDQPCWIDGEEGEGWPISEIVPMQNAIVHLPSLADGKPCQRKPTPRLFSDHVLSYDFVENAPQPKRWLETLDQYFPKDQESIDTIQEWIGLNLVPDTRYQKIMGFIGPPRSGKGTIVRVLQSLVGKENYGNLRFSTMTDQFDFEPMIGKLSLIIPDGRVSAKADQAAIAEALLSISGEDSLTLRRKYRATWTGRLSCRITLLSNELPRIADSSGALANRFIIVKFRQSFLGKEDLNLESKLRAELPGIFRWAVEGWKRLRDRGYFIQPKSGDEEFESMKSLGSPISEFINDRLIVGPQESAVCKEVYSAWAGWCTDNNQRNIGSDAAFGRLLRSVLPELKTSQRGTGKDRSRVYTGVGLIPPDDFGPAPGVSPGGPILDDNGNPLPF